MKWLETYVPKQRYFHLCKRFTDPNWQVQKATAKNMLSEQFGKHSTKKTVPNVKKFYKGKLVRTIRKCDARREIWQSASGGFKTINFLSYLNYGNMWCCNCSREGWSGHKINIPSLSHHRSCADWSRPKPMQKNNKKRSHAFTTTARFPIRPPTHNR